MKGRFLVSPNEDPAEGNVYADKSSLILDWLLRVGLSKESFSLREVAKETGVSLGLVQRVFKVLELKGLLQVEGVRTAKRFSFNKPKELLESWLEHYSIVKKCKIKTYRSALSGKSEWFKALKKSGLDQDVILALHSAAEAHGYKFTNLEGLELYVLDPSIRAKLENALQLEPQERGYEVLLIEPYYKMLLNQSRKGGKAVDICPILLVFLDLYHFPLRGQEQAEFIAQRASELKRICKSLKNK
ncbi:MAG TPA: type IV toxin-antitoxin system AbiEi family antitoxin [Chlamydiales bacterium]|nr:type IV toxin-antitoxin system AbiEi family antitoxin [Chlamydiales bacterium]